MVFCSKWRFSVARPRFSGSIAAPENSRFLTYARCPAIDQVAAQITQGIHHESRHSSKLR
jgi:hypothetical protein